MISTFLIFLPDMLLIGELGEDFSFGVALFCTLLCTADFGLRFKFEFCPFDKVSFGLFGTAELGLELNVA